MAIDILCLVIAIGGAIWCGCKAKEKGYSFWWAFFLGCICWPPVLIVLCLVDKRE